MAKLSEFMQFFKTIFIQKEKKYKNLDDIYMIEKINILRRTYSEFLNLLNNTNIALKYYREFLLKARLQCMFSLENTE